MEWFTPQRRQAIQLFLGTLAPVLILFGFGTQDAWEQILIITGAALVFIAALINVINLKGGKDGWTILRGAIYTLAGTVSPALVVLGVYNAETNAGLLTGLSLGLAALNNLLAIFTNGEQQNQVLRNTIEILEMPEPRRRGNGPIPGSPLF